MRSEARKADEGPHAAPLKVWLTSCVPLAGRIQCVQINIVFEHVLNKDYVQPDEVLPFLFK